jgi:hypothetical protein
MKKFTTFFPSASNPLKADSPWGFPPDLHTPPFGEGYRGASYVLVPSNLREEVLATIGREYLLGLDPPMAVSNRPEEWSDGLFRFADTDVGWPEGRDAATFSWVEPRTATMEWSVTPHWESGEYEVLKDEEYVTGSPDSVTRQQWRRVLLVREDVWRDWGYEL